MGGLHPARCWVDAACIAGIGASVLGWLPAIFASLASIAATIYYTIHVIEYFRRKGTDT